ncbi:hypothetical protein Plec18167_005336 [Paecilomyces lecythidis]|uniref:Phenol 2-monooxygenase n=1 Tax=Paecilomyces lecythidis TaxID=3004212 RepID=A0ABR3XK62_9EURO
MAPQPVDSLVDVLIVGAGPAGLMAATWMSRCGIKTRIVDKRSTKIFTGQADGLQCRTLEIFDSFGFADKVWRDSNHMLEICLWNPDENGKLRRSDRIPDTIPGISRFQQVVLHQGRIERFFLDSLKEHSDISVERGVLPETLEIEDASPKDREAYPVKVTLRYLSEEEATPATAHSTTKNGTVQSGLFRSNLTADDTEELLKAARTSPRSGSTEVVRAKYVIGCDGAHSWVRRQLGFNMEGEQTDYIWGVLDIIPITDFPDIRMRCAIHSESSGSVMVIPREEKLVRLYIQLTTTEKGGGQDRSKITPDMILKSAQKIMAPYKIDYEHCSWWTAYQIGQRVGSNFSKNERVFLAGDAVHTHSPKAGQGMNVSMQDTYNLGWKIANVVNGIADPAILKTYQSERRRIAQDLIAFDHRFSRLFSGRPAKDVMDEAGISMKEFKEAFEKGNRFASGTAVDYGSSVIVAKPGDAASQGDGTDVATTHDRVIGKQSLSSVIQLGMRMPSFKVLNQADARPWHFQELLKSDGRWRLVVFAGAVKQPEQAARIKILGAALSDPKSFIHRFTPADAPIDSVIEVLTIHSSPRWDVELLEDFPDIFHPFKKDLGWDYWKVYVDDNSYHEGHGQAYKNYDVDPVRGCMVVLRPDQYVSWIGELEDVGDMDKFFSGFMQERC